MRILAFLILLIAVNPAFLFSQCEKYQIYESFTSTLPTQGGTWTANSMIAVTTPVRTGTHSIGFNGTGDWIRTPLITNPGVLSFWYRRSSNTTAWTLRIQTSPDGTTWTNRGSITAITATYQQYTLDIGALGLTNVYIRLLDARTSGAHERYVDDLGITSTSSTQNILIPFIASCSQSINTGDSYNITDNGGPAGPISTGYSNSVDRTITITPSDNTKKVNLYFTQMDLEIDYDYLYIYDGPNTSSPLISTITGTVIPSDIVATNPTGELTIRWTTDISNVGAWGGFYINATIITPLPVELYYFEGFPYSQWNVLKWATASEHNSMCFDLEYSEDGFNWINVDKKQAAGNSNTPIQYSYTHYINKNLLYYRLVQYDFDGKFEIFGPISIFRSLSAKKIIKHVNALGQEVGPEHKGLVFEIYEDGSSIKIFR
jgi:hypothetical protein